MSDTQHDPFANPYFYEGDTPPPPPPPTKRRTKRFLVFSLCCVLLLTVNSGIWFVFLHSYGHDTPALLTRKTTPLPTVSPTPTFTPTATPVPITAQDVIIAIMKQPINDVKGYGVSYGSSVANWLGDNAYTDSVPSSSSATWNYTSPNGGPCCLSGIWVYPSQANAHQEYMTLYYENSVYQNDLKNGIGVPQFPNVLTDVGIISWLYVGYCVGGDISANDALVLEDACGA